MRKLIVLLMIVAFCLCSCDMLYPLLGDNTTPDMGDTNQTPGDGTQDDTGTQEPDETDEPDSPSDKHKHTYTSVLVEATCTEGGYIAYSCECGKSFTTDSQEPLGHSYRGGSCVRCGVADPNPNPDPDPDPNPNPDPDPNPGECDAHTDVNDDGYCDSCSEYVIVIVDIFGINDLHGKAKATDSQPGIGALTTYLKSVMSTNAILLSSGDMWQGSSESNLTYGALITDWMNELGFVSMTLGNHEYDWGESYISTNAAIAEFPILGINVFDSETGKRAEYATPSVIVSRAGVEIGIIGAIGDCYSSISGAVSGGFYFKTGTELADLVKAEAERLRSMGVDFIVYSLHDGTSGYQSVLSDGYVDLVFEGHTHSTYVNTDGYGVYHLQGGGENKGLAYALVSINSANGKTKVTDADVISNYVYSSYAEDPILDELLEKYADVIDGAYDVLGTNSRYRDDSEVEQLVADLYYQYAIERWGDEYDIVLAGGFIRTRAPYNLYAGDVTYSDIYSLLPFDNELVLCSIKGSDLKRKFINTTNSDYYISYGDYNLSSISDSKTYYVVVDTYTSTYSSNRLTEVELSGENMYARDLMAEFIKNGGWC